MAFQNIQQHFRKSKNLHKLHNYKKSLNNLYTYNLLRYYYNNLLLFSYSFQFEKPFIQYFHSNFLKVTSLSDNAFA